MIVAAGRPGLIKGPWLKPGAVVLDVGFNVIPDPTNSKKNVICGDVCFESAREVQAPRFFSVFVVDVFLLLICSSVSVQCPLFLHKTPVVFLLAIGCVAHYSRSGGHRPDDCGNAHEKHVL